MFVLRPIAESDLPQLVELARSIDGSLTTLPPNEDYLQDRVRTSLQSFAAKPRKPGGEFYLFVLADSTTGALAGTSGIVARVGGFEPWYSYEIRTETHVHRPLKIEKTIPVLHLKQEHRGPSELCSLYLRADRRRAGAGRLLSLGRLLYMGMERARFMATVVAEMRGYVDQTGRSPFWEAVGRHFFEFDFYSADARSGLGEKEFIADLMPRHPIYVPLLAPEVQAVISRVHHDTEPALALLLAEGFARTNEIDIFDAGPLIRATVDELRTLRLARGADLAAPSADVAPAGPPHLVAVGGGAFRAVLTPVDWTGPAQVRLPVEAMKALQAEPGMPVRVSPAR